MIDLKTCFTYTYSAGTDADLYEAITAAAVSANYIDLDAAGIRPAGGKPPWLVVKVGTVFATIVSMGIKLVSDSVIPVIDAATGIDVVIYRFALARMTAGALLINQPLPHFKYRQFLTLEWEPYTEGTGSLLAYLSQGPETAPDVVEQTVEAGS